MTRNTATALGAVLFAAAVFHAAATETTTGTAAATGPAGTAKEAKAMSEVIHRTEEEWRRLLTPEQFHILRGKGTERPFMGSLLHVKEDGTFSCAGCGNPLFSTGTKFDSGCGWPSFSAPLAGDNVTTATDTSHGMVRTEVMCARCGGHLGHVFDDGPAPTGLRYCINSVSLKFDKAGKAR